MTDNLRALAQKATPGPWLLGWWSGQAERQCNCPKKGPLLGKREQNQYPGEGPFHIHETDFYPDEHRLSGAAPECVEIAGNYDYEGGGIVEPADAAYIAAVSPDVVLALLDRIAALEGALGGAQKRAHTRGNHVELFTDCDWPDCVSARALLSEAP